MTENADLHGDVLPRLAADHVRRAMRTHPVVAIMGSRQTGKSTLVQTIPALSDYDYVTLDDLEVRGQARAAPDDLVRRAPRLVIDEVQREPNLVLAIKSAIDRQRPRAPGRFVLTGSANLLLMKRISETLAGRAVYVPIWPLTHREQRGSGSAGIWSELLAAPVTDWYDLVRSQEAAAEDWRALARRGGYPTPSVELREDEDRALWFSGYVTTYLERDLQDLSAIENLAEFRRLMRLTALRIGTVMNQALLARDAGLPPATAHRYLNLLETSYQLVRLEPYAVNRTKRLVKSPKIFWNDPGLAMFLAGEPEAGGAHFENLILADLIAWRDVQVNPPQILYWRTASGAEVDFVIEHEGGLFAIEAKSGTRVGHDDSKSIREFREEYGPAFRGGLVLYSGSETFWLSEGILAAPWWRVF